MGGSNFGASFAAAHGSRIITKNKAQILFTIFVILGAITLGRPVAETLSNRIIPIDLLKLDTLLIILISATISVFIANLIHVPQSTSLVTVGAIVGVGLYYQSVNYATLRYLALFWTILPITAYGITYFLGKLIYPPHSGNFWLYEKLVNHDNRLKVFVVIASCYNAFSVGANNVANAAGPLAGAGIVNITLALLLVAPLFGLGSIVFTGPLKTSGKKIVPLGLLSATLICLVAGTLTIIASVLGVPQSFVMIKLGAVFAISGLKDGHKLTFTNPATKKTYLTWLITPVISIMISFLLITLKHAFIK